MIDLHCHILPGVDDGPQSVEESLVMAESALRDGVRTMVATPHMLNGVYENDLSSVRSDLGALERALVRKGLLLRLHVGGDVHVAPGMVEAVRNETAVTIDNGRKYLLLELPSQSVPPGVKEEVFQLRIHGITPIITHPERNPSLSRDRELLRELVEMGALAQVTAMSLTGDFGEAVRDVAETLLKRRLVHVIATDAHSPRDRPPVLSRGVEAAAAVLGRPDEAERMVTEVPAAILAGDPLEVPEPA
jgi:protein-tyrosine phosphatase